MTEDDQCRVTLRLPAKLLELIDARVKALQAERPGVNGTDVIRELLAKGARETHGGEQRP